MKLLFKTTIIFTTIILFFGCQKKDSNISSDLNDFAVIPFNSLLSPRLLAPSSNVLKNKANMAAYLLVSLNHYDSKYVINDATLMKVCSDLSSPNIYHAYNFLKRTENIGSNQENIKSFANTEQGKNDWIQKILASLKSNRLVITFINNYPVMIYGISVNNNGDGIVNICTSPLQSCIGLQPAVEQADVMQITQFWTSSLNNNLSNNSSSALILCVGK